MSATSFTTFGSSLDTVDLSGNLILTRENRTTFTARRYSSGSCTLLSGFRHCTVKEARMASPTPILDSISTPEFEPEEFQVLVPVKFGVESRNGVWFSWNSIFAE